MSVFRASHWLGWICLCAALAGVAVAQAPTRPSESSPARPVADEEPITPIPPPPAADPLKLALGERLFNDPRLSADGKFSCSSCHDIRTNGADGKTAGRASGPFDTLTVFNAALNFRLDWEGNFRSLAAQAEASIENPANLHTTVDEVVRKLNADADLVRDFRAAYGRPPERDNFLDALVTFERSLLTPGSRFDRWLEGDASALSADQLKGYRLFKSFGCSSCHQGVNVGGNLFERQGVFRQLVAGQPETVRVPSLRNVATTAPYFHDGSAATLQEAVKRMAAAQLDRTLTDQQVTSLVAFLQTLTGNYRGSPVAGATP
ncbi:MAG TPA: cytochrome c peroxidase [Bradyrhizobium sp.]|nr:cytochrome c peroxidase [Bradyrhizobium sp.]